MSKCRTRGRGLTVVMLALLLTTLVAVNTAQAQDYPKSDLFVGYQWLNPGATVPSPFQPFNNPIAVKAPSLGNGLGAAYTYNFTKFAGLEGDFGHNWNDFGHETTLSFGPRFMWRQDDVNLFIHTLLSYNRFAEDGIDTKNGIGAILGGGLDLNLWKRVSWRVFEADYVWARQNFANEVGPSFPDLRRVNFDGARLRTGLVFSFGNSAPEVPPTATCSVQPSEVMVGEPVTATVTTANFNPKHTLTYNWTGNGGKLEGKDTTAHIDTAGVAGGSYTVTANVTDAKAKKNNMATCTANYTVKEPPKNPPTMSCSANPASVQAGTPVNLTCTCTSPDSVPVNVAGWTATSGTVSGSGANAKLDTTGAPSGQITVNATCTDSRGLTASSSTQVTVENPPPPPPQASKLSECSFENMNKIGKPWRVDNECKAILDNVASNLQQNADNTLVIVGNAEPTEKRKNLAAERAVNSKAYLVGGEAKQGIDPSRITTQTGSAGTKTAEFWIVPPGATAPSEGTQPVDETKVKPVPDHPRAPAKKKAQ
jgi:hypothetical protein